MAAPIKVCRIQSRICVGGPAHHTILLSARLNPSRFETVLIGGGLEPGEADLIDEARRRGVRTVRVPEMRRKVRPGADLLAYRRLCSILRKERPEIVHTHTAKAGALGRLAARACGVPVVVHTFHGHVLDGYFHPVVRSCFRQAERMLARLTDRIVVISESQRRDLAEVHRVAPPRKMQVIPLGLDLGRFLDCRRHRGPLRAELGVSAGDCLIGWVGRFAEVKDPPLFLQACALLGRDREKRFRFIMVGDGELRGRAEAVAGALGIASRTRFLGYRDDLDRVYADLDLLLLTSRNEGTPVAMIEAMSAGVPVVAPGVGGVEDTARGYPSIRIVRDRSPESFAAAAGALLSQGNRRADGRPVALRFGAERLLRETEGLYEQVLEERGVGDAPVPGTRRQARAA